VKAAGQQELRSASQSHQIVLVLVLDFERVLRPQRTEPTQSWHWRNVKNALGAALRRTRTTTGTIWWGCER